MTSAPEEVKANGPAPEDMDDEEDETKDSSGALTTSDKRRAQNNIFEEHIRSNAFEESCKARGKAQVESLADEQQSIRTLMASQEAAEIIKNPRDYQMELFERAKHENLIAVLDTGSGKTLIAVLLLRWVLDNELENRAAGHPPKVAFFLVHSVNLVFQQSAVLETNLSHNVARFFGAMGVDTWPKALWDKQFDENKAIVCTADILLACLGRSYITMKQINLLIFDEAHHAKKNDAYARIIKDHYLAEPDTGSRPRVFGMTASPVDAKINVAQAAVELETLLHSQIITTGKLTSLQPHKHLEERILPYPMLRQCFATDLGRETRTNFGHITELHGVLDKAEAIASHLGSWCADQYLLEAMSGDRLRKYEGTIEQKFNARSSNRPVTELDEMLVQIRRAFDSVQREVPRAVVDEKTELSSKTLALAERFSAEFERPSSHRCIVFVEQKITARLLHRLFEKIGCQHLRCGSLIGAQHSKLDEQNLTLKQQVLTLMKFRKGELNCLFATSVAEEGLDVPDCNLVIRFDMYKTMIQYVQSRGRARQNNSRFIHMVEQGNASHTQTLNDVRFQELQMRSFCSRLPANRQLMSEEDAAEQILSSERKKKVWVDPESNTKLTYDNALVHLAHFISAIPTDSDEPQYPTYVVSSSGSRFIAEVILPSGAPIKSVIGDVSDRKSLAKRSAAFNACLELREKQYLDKYLLPTYVKKLPAMRNALLAVNMKQSSQYPMMTKPSVWQEARGSVLLHLWVTIIDFSNGLDHKHRPLAFLTRTRMPQFPPFPLYLQNDEQTMVEASSLKKAFSVTRDEANKLGACTFRVFQDVFSKKYAEEVNALPYFLVPVAAQCATPAGDTRDCLDWVLIEEISSTMEYKWTSEMDNRSLEDRFFVDIWDGSRKLFTRSIHPSLQPHDPVPTDATKAKWNDNILDYSISLYKNARESRKASWSSNQPVIAAEKVMLRRNMLEPLNRKETSLRTAAYICPEPFRISVLPSTFAASCFAWPAIIWRLESQLIALEACAMIGITCEPRLALAAITKDSDDTGAEHEAMLPSIIRRGMGENYERLEFLGDSFLKMATTLSTFIQNPDDNEFEFHVKRMLLLCNKNLFEVAVRLELYKYIRSLSFSRRLWYPEGLQLLEGKGANKQNNEAHKHSLGEKTIADVSEALIGAAFLHGDVPGQWCPDQWENAVRAVTKLVGSDDHKMQKWEDYKAAYDEPSFHGRGATASQRDMAEKIAQIHSYHFRSPTLLRSAFLHPSQPFLWERLPNYQRLEFLGDALLDMVIISHLFYRFSDKDPQWLTEAKMVVVGNKFLGALACELGFHRHLRHNSSVTEIQIREYATELFEAKSVAGGARDYWTTVSDPPKCLADIVEAYVGALFIDSDFDYGQVQRFFDAHIKWHFEDMAIYSGYVRGHPVTQLHHLMQTTYGCRGFRSLTREMPAVTSADRKEIVVGIMIHQHVVATSTGSSSRYASVRAAMSALSELEGLAPYQFRARYGCDCTSGDSLGTETGGEAITEAMPMA